MNTDKKKNIFLGFFLICVHPCSSVDKKGLYFTEMKFTVLGSGSTGNSVLICTEKTKVLVDVGLSAKETLRRLALVGVDDWSWGQLRWNEAQRGFDPRRPSVLLSHQPRVLDMPEASKHSLILAGHTHGGQVSLPLIGAPVRFAEEFRYVAGFYRRGETQLFVTRGTGVVALPVRIGAPPEISVIKLRRA